MLRQKLQGDRQKYRESLDKLSSVHTSVKKRALLDQSSVCYDSPSKENTSLNETQASFKSRPPVFMKQVQESLDKIQLNTSRDLQASEMKHQASAIELQH